MGEYTHIIHSFEPVFNKNSRVLILGSLPSVKSREEGFYYGHPRNRFWAVTAALAGKPLPKTIDEKKAMLLGTGIAVWDVVSECDIIGSSDASIKNVVPTDLGNIIACCPDIAVFANGGTAARLYAKYQQKKTGRPAVSLPSTSPANAAWSTEKLIARWSALTAGYLQSSGL
jgi:hypoxanthine-DNA glycosylase